MLQINLNLQVSCLVSKLNKVIESSEVRKVLDDPAAKDCMEFCLIFPSFVCGKMISILDTENSHNKFDNLSIRIVDGKCIAYPKLFMRKESKTN